MLIPVFCDLLSIRKQIGSILLNINQAAKFLFQDFWEINIKVAMTLFLIGIFGIVLLYNLNSSIKINCIQPSS